MSKTLHRLKYEVNKMQESDKRIIKALTDDDPSFHSWLQEDKHHKAKKSDKKLLRKEKIKAKYLELRQKLPEDLEFFLGEKVWDKVGIGGFLVGIALFINVSMEMEWINTFGRLFFGIILTLILLIGGYLIRKKYFHFSNVVIGGGIASLIFTIFAAYYQYHLIPLALWIIITIFIITSTIFISIAVKRHEIVLITFIAAYLAPFTVHFIGSDYLILFSYLTLLNVGVIIYDYYQKSMLVNLVSFGFTFMTYEIWLIAKIFFYHEEIPYLGAFLFLTLFYIMFFLMVLMNNIREGNEFHKKDFSFFMMAKGIYFGAGAIIINASGAEYMGLFAGLIGIINYIYFLALYRRKNFDRRILNLFLGLSIMFFSLIIPIEFYGKTITMVWAFQTVILMFIVVRAKNDSMRFSSFIISIGMIVSLFIDLYQQYVSTTAELEYITPIFNQGFLSSMMAITSLATLIFLSTKLKGEYFINKLLKIKYYQAFLGFTLVLTTYITFLLEIRYSTLQRFDNIDLVDTFTSVYNLAFLGVAAIPAFFLKKKPLAAAAIGVAVLSALLYIGFYSQVYVTVRSEYLLGADISRWQFNIHYLGAFILLVSLVAALKNIKILFPNRDIKSFLVTYVLVFFVVFLVSAETTQIFTTKLYEPNVLAQNIVSNLYRFAYSMAWGITSLLFIILGFIYKIKEIRIAGISLYFIAGFKIILYDFWTNTNQELMASFAIMGVILLITSFLFQYSRKHQQKLA
ncbi:MAG: DUF2339 domain-containing protein [Bacteroidales bacterium]|nr:DUF2339 domain-containing protein [Bacteroidales bacterium]